MQIPQGSVIAFVGPSGSGKSTLVKLISRFFDVDKGMITIGNKNIKEIQPDSLMQYMSFVFQDVILFNDTIYNNIHIGNMKASKEEVIAAAKAAMIHEYIEQLPGGYDTVLGENGATLSGGQRQRLSIARAILKDAPIILLDEATASLDPENEVLIQKAISKLVRGKTVIMIAHRLKTITEADQIFVLNNGKIVEQGTHKQLLMQQGLYHKLFYLQKDSANWAI
nr:ATP-binding cassette domain-containing protein [Thomasclavelia saccharogumia]